MNRKQILYLPLYWLMLGFAGFSGICAEACGNGRKRAGPGRFSRSHL